MASFTSSQSGLWSSASTWSGAGVPGDGDTVTIASGHTVTFDVDQSSFASGLAGLTINGTLKFKEDSVTCLKMASNVSIMVNGSLICGDENSPIQRPPVGSSTRTKIILQGTDVSTKIMGASNATIKFVGWTPTRNRTKLAANANSGSNQIILEDSLSLQSGDEILIGAGSINGGLTESRYGIYTVSDVSSDGKTITLSQNLGHSRLSGDYVAWYSRPIDIQREAGEHTISAGGAYLTICGVKINQSITWTATPFYKISDPHIKYATITGGFLVGNAPSGESYVISDSTFYNVSLTWGNGVTIKDSVFIHRNDPNFGFLTYPNNLQIKNTWFQNSCAIYKRYTDLGHGTFYIDSCEYKSLYEVPFSFPCEFYVKNMIFNGTPQNRLFYDNKYYNCIIPSMGVDYSTTFKNKSIHSYNHNQINGAYRAWMSGGTVQNLNATQTEPYRYQLTSTLTTIPVYHTIQLGTLNPIEEIRVSTMIKRQTGASTKPIIQLITPLEDPLINPSIMPLAETQYPDESTGIWRKVTLTYYNDKPSQIPIHFRILSMEGSGRTIEFTPPRVTNRTGLRGQKVKIMRR